MRTKRKKRQTKKKRGRFFIWLILLALFMGLLYYVLSLPIWQIKNVVVNNTQILSAQEVLGMAGIPLSKNLFFTSLSRSRANLNKISAIKSYKIYRLPPATILINVEERVPVAAIVFPGRSYFIDEDGYIINRNQNMTYNIGNITDLPVIDGIAEKTLLAGVKLDDQTAQVVFQVVLELSRFLSLGKIRLEITGGSDVNLLLDDVLKVKLGEAEQLDDKMKILKALLPQVADKWPKVEYIDVRYLANPVIKLK